MYQFMCEYQSVLLLCILDFLRELFFFNVTCKGEYFFKFCSFHKQMLNDCDCFAWFERGRISAAAVVGSIVFWRQWLSWSWIPTSYCSVVIHSITFKLLSLRWSAAETACTGISHRSLFGGLRLRSLRHECLGCQRPFWTQTDRSLVG